MSMPMASAAAVVVLYCFNASRIRRFSSKAVAFFRLRLRGSISAMMPRTLLAAGDIREEGKMCIRDSH